ncbi:MAG TPA: hypothetical protein VHT21_08740 [Stellaceae bacterium]|nr:hypothetical protein [Stellaceae bacterium]
MDERLFAELRKCGDAERLLGPRFSFAFAPLDPTANELVEAGYLIAHEVGHLVFLSVTDKGFQAVAH